MSKTFAETEAIVGRDKETDNIVAIIMKSRYLEGSPFVTLDDKNATIKIKFQDEPITKVGRNGENWTSLLHFCGIILETWQNRFPVPNDTRDYNGEMKTKIDVILAINKERNEERLSGDFDETNGA